MRVAIIIFSCLVTACGADGSDLNLGARFAARDCTPDSCAFALGETVFFLDAAEGEPEAWDYDWDGDGTFEDEGNTQPVEAMVYIAPDAYRPSVRVRMGDHQDTFVHAHVIQVAEDMDGADDVEPMLMVEGPRAGHVAEPLEYSVAAVGCSPREDGWTWQATPDGQVASASLEAAIITFDSLGDKTIVVANSACQEAGGELAVEILDDGR